MKVHYIKRIQSHDSEHWGVQVSCVKSHLLRATTIGNCYEKKPMRVIWEWVSTGERIEGTELERLMRVYPICEFQSDEDLTWRIQRAQAQKEQSK